MRKYLTIDGRRLSYLEQGSAGATRALVLLHAFPLNADMWAPQFAPAPAGWHLIAPEFRGFGESDPDRGDLASAGLALEDYARDVMALLDRLAVRRPIIAGLSLGGYVIFAMQRLIGARGSDLSLSIGGVVLADTRPQADTPEGRAGRQRMIDLVDRDGVAAVATDMLPKLVADETRQQKPDVVEGVRRMIAAASPEAIKGALYRMMSRPDSTPQLAELKCPTLIVVGERDSLTPPNLSREMQTQVTGAMLEIIPAAGHLSNLERPEEFNKVLTRFLDRL